MPTITRGHRNLLAVAATLATLLVALGSMVCATDSSAACPDWPGCFGRVIPPPNINAILEYTHRVVAALTGLLILVSAWLGWRRARAYPWIFWPALLAIPFTGAVVLFGRAAVLTGLPRHLAILDLGSALVVLALLVTASVVSCAVYAAQQAGSPAPTRLRSGPNAPLALAALVILYLVYITGILTAGSGSLTRCIGWPMLSLIPTDVTGWPQVVRLVAAALAAALILLLSFRVLRAAPAPTERRLALVLPLVLLVEWVLGLVILTAGPTLLLDVTYVSLATVLFAALTALAVRLRLPAAGPR